MIEVGDLIKLKIVAMRKDCELPSHFEIQDLEDRIDDIKLRIYKLQLELGYNINTTKEFTPRPQNHVHKVESKRNVKPSSNLYASLSSNPSFRNAVRT